MFAGYEAFEDELQVAPVHHAKVNPRLRQARRSYASLVKAGAQLFVGKSAGHSGHEILVLVPPNLDASRPLDVRVHYHGMHSTASAPNSAGRIPARISAQWQRGEPTVFVFPFASLDARSYPNWGPARSTRQTALDALRLAKIEAAPARVIVSGHSAGGAALSRLISRSGLECDLLILEDCFYGNPFGETRRDVIAWGKTTACRQVISFHGTNSRWICPADLPNQQLRHVCAQTKSAHYEHVLLDPYAALPSCTCPVHKKRPVTKANELEAEDFETPQQKAISAVARTALIPFAYADIPVTLATALSVCKLVALHLSMPWQVVYLVMEHEGGLGKAGHKDGVMQTIDGSRTDAAARLPEAFKQVLANDQTLTGAALNRRVLQVFSDGSKPSRRLCAQIALGAEELRHYLSRYEGYVALGLAAYNTGSGPKPWVAAQDSALSRAERCRRVASAYHQPVSALSISGGQWICDPNMPGWAWRASVKDASTARSMRGYQYLRGVASKCTQKPADPCLRSSPKGLREPCAGNIVSQSTRPGALQKLFDPKLMRSAYQAAIAGQWPTFADDGKPLRAVGTQLIAEAAAAWR